MAGTWSLPLIDRDEPRFAEASREMIQRHDYVVPFFNNHYRFDKPPLTYWAQVASYRTFGENDFAARFPSTIAAALIAVSLLAWGSRVGSERAGWWAAIIFTLSLQTLIHGKAAVADMWVVLFVTLAYWAGFELARDDAVEDQTSNFKHRTFGWWWIFYLSLGLAFLAKGPIGWVPLLTVPLAKIYRKHLNLHQRFKFIRGILLMLAVVALWGVPAVIRTHGEFFTVGIGRHVIGRSIATMEGHGANSLALYLLLLPFYLVTVFVSMFPWSIKFPWLAHRVWRTRDKIDNYLLIRIGVIFLIFTLIKTKLPHYTLPAFPLLALLLARHWAQQNRTIFKPVAIAATSAWLTIALVGPLLAAQSFPAYALYQRSRTSLRPDMEFGAIDYTEPSLVWYFRSRVNGFMTPLKKKEAVDYMNKSGPRFVIASSSLAGELFPNPPATWKTFSTSGINIAKGKRVDLTLMLKSD